MQAAQATIDQWQSEPTNPLPFDTFGPTSRRPLPVEEEKRQPWKAGLRRRGFSPNFILDVEGIGKVHIERDLHPDDEHRDQWPGSDRTAFELAEERRA